MAHFKHRQAVELTGGQPNAASTSVPRCSSRYLHGDSRAHVGHHTDLSSGANLDHPARKIIGSLNPCFGWDYPPASILALLLCSCNVLLWRYAWLEIVRTHMSAGGLPLSAAQRFASGPPSSSPPLPTSGCCCGSSGLRMATGSGTRPSSYCMPSRHSSRASGITSRRSTTRRDVTTSRGGNTSTMPSLASPRCSCQQSTSQTVRAGHPPGHPPRSAYPREDQSISPSRRLACELRRCPL